MTEGLSPVLAGQSAGDGDEYAKALLNVLEDFWTEREQLEGVQRASLNVLEDFADERERTEAANRDLLLALESLRLAKEDVDSANRELEAFAYSVSHDLRAPLRTIGGFSQVLLEDCARQLSAEGRDSLHRIVAAVEKMGQLIDDLLNLSRVTRVEMVRGPVDLSRLARKIFEELRMSRPDRRAELVVADGLVGTGDERLLGVVLRNLFDNAWKFTSRCEKTRIEFGTAATQGGPAYLVRDNGTGFDMAYAGKLFQPFQRMHAVREYPGTGIGLATVKRIIERHSGRVWIEAAPGQGTTVYFTLGNEPEDSEVP